MKIKLYPKGYDAMVASGPPDKTAIKAGVEWTEEDTIKHRLMEDEAEIIDVDFPPIGRVYTEIG